MSKFRKKPVVIEAIQLRPDTYGDVVEFLGAPRSEYHGDAPRLFIQTLEGRMEAINGDWIIKGVKGEFYPCKPDIFEATYEAAE